MSSLYIFGLTLQQTIILLCGVNVCSFTLHIIWIDGAVVARIVAHSRLQLSGERGARMKTGLGETRVIPITLRRPVRPQTHHRVTECCTTEDEPKKRSITTDKKNT